MPIIAYNMAKMKQNGVLRFIIKSQTWQKIFSGTNERVARDLEAQWKIRLWIQLVRKLLVMIYPLTLHNMITPNEFYFQRHPKLILLPLSISLPITILTGHLMTFWDGFPVYRSRCLLPLSIYSSCATPRNRNHHNHYYNTRLKKLSFHYRHFY